MKKPTLEDFDAPKEDFNTLWEQLRKVKNPEQPRNPIIDNLSQNWKVYTVIYCASTRKHL